MKVGIYTLGCKVNLYESEYVRSLLEKAGYEMASFDDICDVYIINTCTVTNQSDAKDRKMIRSAIRRNPHACVVVMGCFIEANQDLEIPGVDIYIGNKDKGKVVEYIDEWMNNRQTLRKNYKGRDIPFEDMEITTFEGRTRAFVKIQDGCDNFCSYCIIPFVRGKCRSKDFNTVLEEISQLVQKGYQEIVLTGIHTGNYGRDIDTDFAHLLKEIVKIKGLYRLRISSIEITELNEDVLEVLKNSNVIVDHLHIPLQAGSDKILKSMNRKYDKAYFKKKVEEIRSIRPAISLTTDIIVGFPGETEADFQETMDFAKEIRFAKIHVFPYSKRSGTKAAILPNQVDEKEKKERAKRLGELSKELEEAYLKSFVNKEVEVLIETNQEGYSYGHTSNYMKVKVKGTYPSETILPVTIQSVDKAICTGVIKEKVTL